VPASTATNEPPSATTATASSAATHTPTPTGTSTPTEILFDEYEATAERDLSGFEVEYVFLDAIHESLRQQSGGKEGVMCTWAICADGRKAMLLLAPGNKEPHANWLEFVRDMVRRGQHTPVLVTTCGAPGLMRAVGEVLPNGCGSHSSQAQRHDRSAGT
jgi:transposase-like protein